MTMVNKEELEDLKVRVEVLEDRIAGLRTDIKLNPEAWEARLKRLSRARRTPQTEPIAFHHLLPGKDDSWTDSDVDELIDRWR
jgi:hypothetical protein